MVECTYIIYPATLIWKLIYRWSTVTNKSKTDFDLGARCENRSKPDTNFSHIFIDIWICVYALNISEFNSVQYVYTDTYIMQKSKNIFILITEQIDENLTWKPNKKPDFSRVV